MSEKEPPYIRRVVTTVVMDHNPKHDQDALCICGHPYYRHFDSYEHNLAVGCKYCSCSRFGSTIEEWEETNEQKLFCDPAKLHGMAGRNPEIITVGAFQEIMTFERKRADECDDYEDMTDGFPMKDGKVSDLFHITCLNREEKLPFEPDAYLVFINRKG